MTEAVADGMDRTTNTRGAIFDIDGTLVDSYDAHFEAWRETLAEEGIGYDLEAFSRDFGRRNPEIIGELWDREGREAPAESEVDRVAGRKEQRFRELISEAFPEMKGAGGLMRELHAAGWGVAVGSSAPRANVSLSIDLLGAAPVIDVSVAGEDVGRGKPEPDVFLRAAELLGIEPANCIVIEDARAGVEAARRAGMPAVAIASKGRTREELSEARLVIDTLEEISPERLEEIIKEHSE